MIPTNLVELLTEKSVYDNKGIIFIEGNDHEEFLSYKELHFTSIYVLSFLQDQNIKPKDELVFQIDDNKTFIIVFWACILGGIIPIPLSVGRNDDHRQKLFNVWKILNNPHLIVSSENLQKLKRHADLNGDNELFDFIYDKSLQVDNIFDSDKSGLIHQPDENDVAYIQFSSGSTGNPKGVMLTHKNLITNMKAISEASLYTVHDSKLSWMPLTHDMGLIGFHLCPLFCGMNHFLLPTNLFIRRPTLWLDKATQHKATILCSPNFGYKYLLKHIIPIDNIPLTKNGKINYGLLPVPYQNESGKEEATNEIQKLMVSVWQDALNVTKVGITDNFLELGGDSIKAVQVASRLYDKNISVNVKDILTYQTIEQLCLHAEITDGSTQYEQGIVEGEVELNPIQRWFFEQSFENLHFYNQTVLLKFKKPINKEILKKAFEILIEHHDGLRMNYNPEKEVMFYNNDYLEKEFLVEEFVLKPEAVRNKLQDGSKIHATQRLFKFHF